MLFALWYLNSTCINNPSVWYKVSLKRWVLLNGNPLLLLNLKVHHCLHWTLSSAIPCLSRVYYVQRLSHCPWFNHTNNRDQQDNLSAPHYVSLFSVRNEPKSVCTRDFKNTSTEINEIENSFRGVCENENGKLSRSSLFHCIFSKKTTSWKTKL